MKNKLTTQQYEEIKTRYANKEKVKDLAKEYHVSKTTIYVIINPTKYSTSHCPTCRELGIDKRMKLSESEIERMQHRYNTGAGVAELAQDFGVSKFCIRYHVIPGYAKRANEAVWRSHVINPVKIDPAHRAALERERVAARKAAYRKRNTK